jgi:hypothetical protein
LADAIFAASETTDRSEGDELKLDKLSNAPLMEIVPEGDPFQVAAVQVVIEFANAGQ